MGLYCSSDYRVQITVSKYLIKISAMKFEKGTNYIDERFN